MQIIILYSRSYGLQCNIILVTIRQRENYAKNAMSRCDVDVECARALARGGAGATVTWKSV